MLIHKNFNQQVENILLKMTKRKSTDKTPEGPSKRPNTGHWSGGLVAATEDPKLVVSSDNLITVIKDGYPKAKHHYLVLPKENISSIKSITKDHLDLLKHMDKVGRELIQDVGFKIGYHAEPSMQRLHLHVISDDMDSPCVKTKKHWNSFTTEFFIDSKGRMPLHDFRLSIIKTLVPGKVEKNQGLREEDVNPALPKVNVQKHYTSAETVQILQGPA
ncbi:unnamed protein product [Acanthoscelides obtectus]|uniref:HIT domain-containing protein n=1 Tax=Acanthoscelides obtectus TaxID=200917 RepID=A0A9P0M642_ACAOB|nr:unnamed protein product [Acanthoscelides obtectus]CAK1667121.1 Aprataxin [Acanthoscelides obtectus]